MVKRIPRIAHHRTSGIDSHVYIYAMLSRRITLSAVKRGAQLYSARFYSALPQEKRILKAPSFDVKGIVSNIDRVVEVSKLRELPSTVVDKLPQIPLLYEEVRQLQTTLNTVLKEKNDAQRLVKKELKTSGTPSQELQSLQLSLKTKEKEISTALSTKEKELYSLVDLVPNDIHPSVQVKEDIVRWLNPRSQYEPDLKLEHDKIGVELGILNLKSAATVSGSSWYYLVGDGALLEQALVQYALKLARKHGFITVLPPSIVRNEVADACGFKPRDQNNEVQTYQLINDDLCLTGTAEIPLAGLGINRLFSEKELPVRAVGLSRSYRAEAGARGKDTRGLYRVHEFTKVELFVWATESQSENELEKLRTFQEEFVSSLGLSAKVINMPSNDLGAPAFKKYDIEAWMPGRGTFGEVTSASNCTDYQSRRLQTKYTSLADNKRKYVHTLNGTAVAVPRVIVAIIENFYNHETRTVAIPRVLQPYMDDKTEISTQSKPF
ncbi:putative serine--tRNA ligase DIA4 [Cyberlindnera jadinii NRRL Y-1542]|uniref:serine--tRNA ligase n=2 Tax=Cyberlindnera jadinii (strain ATCC 18201 / CBS 1600 / BCRC 20928 / JCM 3617 / NBRC 0987 / NRRL Y-1542) TaxID=983966 RepID=A0A1E4S6W3_CYBJN|nr:seryl-tRNA synthetase [Cyberlindnera jadinii NRRL Y-1542]ODV75255.1 seryl-tRNA synthetase [Cyberlindnera jadinii NRRL Y-1542]